MMGGLRKILLFFIIRLAYNILHGYNENFKNWEYIVLFVHAEHSIPK